MPRPSPVSDAVRGVIDAGQRHAWALDELLDSVRTHVPGADYSTVFRAVTMLERSGEVNRVEVGDGKARYEPNQEHHEHIRCRDCGQVAQVPGCVLLAAESEIAGATGFQVDGHSLLFSGVCPICQRKNDG
ncbi:MAG: Fur family transcriptional regulator [Candidatus Dormibacter sp.]|uniref:Fur family transcriptional regulator n=1 Tax=Candidatus Dormibacter sp. TaxID=2973982 RepID=UPI0026A37972